MDKAVPNLQAVLSEPTKVGHTTRTGDLMGDIVSRMLVPREERHGDFTGMGRSLARNRMQKGHASELWPALLARLGDRRVHVQSLYSKVDVSPGGVQGWWAVVLVGDPDKDNYAAGAASNQIHALSDP